jgi:transposase, IS5 family
MKRYKPQNQLSIKEFSMPFEADLDENNRWVVMSQIIPWDLFAKEYYKNFKTNRGAPTKDARLVLGVVIIKHLLKLDDVGVIEIIQENPYMQYFLGLTAFTSKPVMDSSSLVHIRKRIDLATFEVMTDELIRRSMKIKDASGGKSKEVKQAVEEDEENKNSGIPNQGKLQLDATVADAEIKFPTDLDMLNDSREKAQELIDYLYSHLDLNKKPRDYRRIARKEFLSLSKKKRKTDKELRRGIKLQINYVKRDIGIINTLLDMCFKQGEKRIFDKHQMKYFFVIQHVLDQQQQMFKDKTHSVDDRIVSIHQPHVRPIVRGKAKAKVEFGAKINVSLQDGYARIDHFDWNAYNEGVDMIMQIERYGELHGHYPKVLLVDKIYLNRENRRWLKEHGIAHTGDPLGRKQKKQTQSAYQKQNKRRECAERNQIEGKFGQGKRGYNLNDIRARLSSTSQSWIGAIIFVLNVIRHMKGVASLLFNCLCIILIRMKQLIMTQFTKPVFNYKELEIIQ